MQKQESRASAATVTEDELTREVVGLASALVGRMWAHHQARVAEFDLSQPEAKALLNLEPDRCLSMRELSALLHANPSNVTVAVGRLEARGLVSRQGADDRRVRGVLLWNVWEQVDAARKLIAEPGPFRPESLQGRLPA